MVGPPLRPLTLSAEPGAQRALRISACTTACPSPSGACPRAKRRKGPRGEGCHRQAVLPRLRMTAVIRGVAKLFPSPACGRGDRRVRVLRPDFTPGHHPAPDRPSSSPAGRLTGPVRPKLRGGPPLRALDPQRQTPTSSVSRLVTPRTPRLRVRNQPATPPLTDSLPFAGS